MVYRTARNNDFTTLLAWFIIIAYKQGIIRVSLSEPHTDSRALACPGGHPSLFALEAMRSKIIISESILWRQDHYT